MHWIAVLVLPFLFSTGLIAQQQNPFKAALKSNLVEPVQPQPFIHATPTAARHAFWDRDNVMLFTAVGAAATADFFVTKQNLASGGKELNPITRVFAGSTPALAANFAGETAGSIALSYFFHKKGHHRLERMTSFVNVGASMGAVGFGLTHR